MMKQFCFFLVMVLTVNAFSQGTVMLVGGGTERSGSTAWNYEPYAKAVSLAENSKVAIIAWGPEDDTWLVDYFQETCNADYARHFDFSAISVANYSDYYDSLMNYDMFFFKGGDQYNYYSNFKNTAIAQAITDKYDEGGVLAGTSAGAAILSSVLYTAENGTVYPDEAINNPMNQYMTLAADFVDLMPGLLSDTHFAERGRLARLVGLLGHYAFTNDDERIMGLGVDDLSAVIVRNDSLYAYGTGAGNLYDVANAELSNSETLLRASNVKVSQLINGCTLDFSTGTIEGFTETSEPQLAGEGGDYTILLGGGIYGDYHTEMLEELVNSHGQVNDNILVITASNAPNVENVISTLENASQGTVLHVEATSANGDANDVASMINDAAKFVFVDNTYATFMDFMNNSANGSLLDQKIRSHGAITAFIGDNSRFAGATVVNEYLVSGAAYYAELQFDPGLALLKTSVIIPNTFKESDIYENTATAMPYAMLQDHLTFGIWLNKRNYATYFVENDSTWLLAYGASPVMVMKNNGTDYGFSVTPNTGSSDARMIAGFEEMTMDVLDGTANYLMGSELGLGIEIDEASLQGTIFPNPTKDKFIVSFEQPVDIELISIDGKILKRFEGQKRYNISTGFLQAGIYFVKARSGFVTNVQKVVVK
ncbi:MAG: Type 1 glutamine amidotransferase-like domain-containing protein [Salinivirgaceae bacterium]|jgi:cyanophycinase|nr:Type 1 glutamine amidotransferase-like domain-containing protein [Salinivirgaceae bacterium]